MEIEIRSNTCTIIEVKETILSYNVEGGKERRRSKVDSQVASVDDHLVPLTEIRKTDTAPDIPMRKRSTCSSSLEDTVNIFPMQPCSNA